MKELIRHIIKEETNRKTRMVKIINNMGIDKTIEMIGGFDKFEKIMDINDPMDYLHLFNGMDEVESKQYEKSFIYRFNPKRNIMMVNPNIERVYINQYEIWNVLRREFDLNNNEALDAVNEWLKDEYGVEDFMLLVSSALDTIK
jgi:hypothetical protein